MMMSSEFPEILPEPFSNPCASYGGNADTFMDEVVKSSLYSSTGYFTKNSSCSYDSEPNRHSLILEDPLLPAQKHSLKSSPKHSLKSSPESLNVNCRNPPPTFQVGIKLVVKEASSDSFPDHICKEDMADSKDTVQVRIKRADDGTEQRASQQGYKPPDSSSAASNESFDSPTPTPSYRELVFPPSIEYPGTEDHLRGAEVARWKETDAGDGVNYQLPDRKDNCKAAGFCAPNSETGLPLDQVNSNSHIKLNLDTLPKRRSHLSHLKLVQSPHILPLPTAELRKLSDPAIHVRRQNLKTSSEPKKQRCLSDSEAPSFPFAVDEDELKSEEGCSSAHGCDSGFHDERMHRFHDTNYSSPRVSLYSSDLHSLEESNELITVVTQQKSRRVTPHPLHEPFIHDDSQSDDQSSVPNSSNPGTMVHPRERSRRSLLKHFSQSSLGGGSVGGASVGGASSIGASSESPSLSSLLETQSNITCATDILSSLGFDDFESPQLVPDRFIPKELEHLRPSSMKAALIEQSFSPDPPRSPDSLASGHSSSFTPSQQRSVDLADLPLGATAENFFPRPGSPITPTSTFTPEADKAPVPASPADTMPLFTDTAAIAGFTRSRILETVPEETASDLSLSPRWLSPRVSIDHSVLDLAEGKLGASLQKVRRRSLPTREGYKLSIGSLVESDAGDSIQLSVTSYDDELAAEREREREGLMPSVCDDLSLSVGRRRRRGVYTPPQTLLSWLSTQKTIDEEADTDPDELPWPFNEQARLRKSLTEMSIAQQNSLSDDYYAQENTTTDDDALHAAEATSQREVSLSPISSPNIRLSPQPSLSEADMEDLNDLEVDSRQSPEQRYYKAVGMETRLKPPHMAEPSRHAVEGVVDAAAGEAGTSLLLPPSNPHSHHHSAVGPGFSPTHSRPRKALISPLSVSRSFLSASDEARPPTLEGLRNASDEVEKSSSDKVHAASLKKLDSKSESSQIGQLQQKETKSELLIQSEEQVHAISSDAQTPPKPGNCRRPRLDTLRQSSIDSQPEIPEDISEIELLTGDLHSPVLSTRKSRVPLKRQENLEELPKSKLCRSRSSRRVAVIGDAPSTTELFSSTDLSDSKSEVGRYMVL